MGPGSVMDATGQFEGFMRSYQNMVFTTAVRLVGNSTEAEDIAQEVFLRAYERFEYLQESPTAGGWLKTVTRNLCLNHLSRYQSRWKFFSDIFSRNEGGEVEVEFPDDADVAMNFETDEMRVKLEGALRRLPTAQRVPLVLFHVEELSYGQIARQLGISQAKVKTDMFRGREALRHMLQGDQA